jgi:predicted outer membrane protein
MPKLRSVRLWSRSALALTTLITAWAVLPAGVAVAAPAQAAAKAEAGIAARPLTAGPDPFNGAIPGDVSNGQGLLPPANNAPSAVGAPDNALPGANVTQTRFGPIDDVDRLFLVKVRQAGLWERPTGMMAQQQAQSERVKEIGRILADEHKQLDEECRFVAKQLNVALPDQPSAEQVGWMREFGPMKGHDFDVTAVKWLRVAHGGVFSAIASVRANTRNEMMRMFAQRANDMVNRHMSLLESTGLVQYDMLPHAAIGAPAVALAAATTPTLLALVSIRRVVRGS